MKKILILLTALLLAAIALPAQYPVYVQLDSTSTAKLTINGVSTSDTIDIGEWLSAFSEERYSPAGNYRVSIIRSIDLDIETCTPFWWAYIITDQNGFEHMELHILNLIVYQGSRFIINATPRPTEWEEMWQRCQF